MRLRIDADNYDACPQYNDWLDEKYSEQYGTLDIIGYQPRPSSVLFAMSLDTYEATFADFMQQREEGIGETVCTLFPSPIAYYFYRFANGYESELQRLHLLRDTWESIVDIIHALAVAEARHLAIPLVDPLKFKDLLTDSVAKKIENIEQVISQLNAAGVASSAAKICPAATLSAMKDLNQSRNAFSHSAAQSEAQARLWINESYAEVIEVLSGLNELANIKIVRYLGQADATTLRCEVFCGYGSTKTIKNITVSRHCVLESGRYFQQGQMLAIVDGLIFGLQPLIHFREDEAGHTTRLCVFRRARGEGIDRLLEYEVVGEAARKDEQRVLFNAELSELRRLFGLGEDQP